MHDRAGAVTIDCDVDIAGASCGTDALLGLVNSVKAWFG